jgi:putative membrane protein
MNVGSLFSPAELAEIERAVKAAERHTSGEIVPYVVARSDDYPQAAWKGACAGALLVALAAAAVRAWGGFWGPASAWWLALPPLAGAALGLLAVALVPPLRRALVAGADLEEAVERRAGLAFLEQEVFKTAERTGILIFLSLFERRVVVLGDAGINRAVARQDWEGIVAGIVAGIRAGTPGTALARAIGQCGELLERHRVERRAGDRDELADHLRIKPE